MKGTLKVYAARPSPVPDPLPHCPDFAPRRPGACVAITAADLDP